MLRLALILSLAIAPAVGVRECASPCADEETDCQAACPECTACTHAPMFEVSGAVATIAPAPAWTAIGEARFSVPQVEPRKVRHVPKAGASSRT